MLAAVILAVIFLVGLALVALGLPGLWLMVATVVIYGWLTGFVGVGWVTIAVVVGLALIGEAVEAWLGFGLARRYGGSKRAGWGALIGGLVGAIIGVPVPVIGSVIGAFIGSFAGAVLFEYTKSRATDVAVRAGWGALVGRAAATAAKMAVGIVIAVVTLFAAAGG